MPSTAVGSFGAIAVDSRGCIELDSLLPSTRFSVHLLALDVDNLAVAFTRAEISVVFGNQAISVQWSRGSSEYVAVVPAELTRQPGIYDLVVRAINGRAGDKLRAAASHDNSP